ncbi:hypothetical protein [Flectobacillus longus]|uniref:hypothetical protein n=1 Tax=Flectobacillus longus TaxID=2984207 RepID=UPI0024B73367|nr:hypothetical protein [Flectobacillus longus]MDI9882128.1 hypothetical protein [Flectobacillus longus]
MWINITKDVFVNSDFKALNFLFQILSYYPSIATKPRYNIVIEIEKVLDTENFKKLASIEPNLSSFLEEEYNAYVTSSAIPYKITSKRGTSNFNIEEAILFLNQPVSIILENNKNDSEFILAIIKHFGNINNYNKAQEHIDNAWLQFENAGGCGNIPNFMEGFLNRFKALARKNSRNISDYFRGVIILDSDTDFPTQPSKHDTLLNKIQKLGIDINSIHILKKRAMENYLPIESFEELQKQRAVSKNNDLNNWISTYRHLSNTQKDFLNISDGFPPKKDKFNSGNIRKPVDTNILSLFSLRLSDKNFKYLDVGFTYMGFDNFNNLKTSGSFKDEFPNLFRKSIITKINLKDRDGIGELQSILDKITALL